MRWIVVGFMACACTDQNQTPAPARQNPSPMVETSRTHGRISEELPPGRRFTVEIGIPNPVTVFVPEHVRDSATLLVHFHGSISVAAHAVSAASVPSVAAVVQLGAGSSAYERPFLGSDAFPRLLKAVSDSVTVVRTVVSAFSAGYGAARALLKNDGGAELDGLILLDGLHASYKPENAPLADGGMVDETNVLAFTQFAQGAVDGRHRFVVTHSSIFPGTYVSTTEASDWIVARLGLKRSPILGWGPNGMQQVSKVRAGNFRVMGFAGNTAPDHIDHLHALPFIFAEVLKP
jgi:hypothetical protein